ncbi:hypothetical protein H9Y04_27885 [Streptomyces sp. TRM66268-LWL]|uniref:Secreted protein n=1 Tax=Streptomyces polyasparticus TaxID=2767826 RepID=A0ABR7SLQ1_9ACTN|nr:hypothetical protein [Streptomyces polyasparticus]MBC9716362.1 hypothetical protein [Streptomyces polyasparticus]
MNRAKKVAATLAIATVFSGIAGPAFADEHATIVTPLDSHAGATPLDSHAGTAPLDSHAGATPLDSHAG